MYLRTGAAVKENAPAGLPVTADPRAQARADPGAALCPGRSGPLAGGLRSWGSLAGKGYR